MNRSTLSLSPHLLLRVEDAALFVGAVFAYSRIAPDWLLFALLILAPDLTMLGYLRNVRLGSIVYNLGHTLALSLGITALGLAAVSTLLVQIGLIWTAHIAIDRVMGFGLKYPTQFKDTHIQRI